MFNYYIFIFVLSSLEKAVALTEDCDSACDKVLSLSDIRLLQEYSDVREKILQVFTNPPSTVAVARDNLVVKFPPDITDDFEGQFQNHGIILSGTCMKQNGTFLYNV